MSQQSQAERERWELDRKRYLELAYVVTGVHSSVAHANALAQPQCEPNVTTQNESTQPSRPATTEPTSSNQNRPEPPDRSISDTALDSDLVLVSRSEENLSRTEDPTRQSIEMFSEVTEKWVHLIAKLDTGVDGNWINESSLQDLRIEAKPNSARLLTFETFDGKTIQSGKQVEAKWGFSEGGRTHRTLFRVAEEGAPFDVVIGRDFLLKEDIVTFNINKSVLLFVKTVRTEAEQKAVAEEQARVEAEDRALEQKRLQEKALRKHLSEKKKNKDNSSGGSTHGEGSSRRRRI